MRRGITRAEFIIGFCCVLIALSLGSVAVQKVRSAAARMVCQGNLKQHALAIHNYHSGYDHFPSGTIPNPELPPEQRLSFHVTLAPYIDCSSLYRQLATTEPWDSPTNVSVTANYKPRVYRCVAWSDAQGSLPTGHLSPTNYVGVAGVGADAATRPADAPGIGIFGYDRTVKAKEVKDGLDNTAMLFETSRDVGPWIRGGPSTVRPVDLDDTPLAGVGRPFGGTHFQTSWVFPNRREPFNVALADGSVRFLTPDADPAILAALATIAGGEELPAEW
jgi:hypothetical protein